MKYTFGVCIVECAGKLGYERCGSIAGYFGPGDDKVIFAKPL